MTIDDADIQDAEALMAHMDNPENAFPYRDLACYIAVRRRALSLLHAVQFAAGGGVTCPVCEAEEAQTHTGDCDLVAVLRDAEGTVR